MSKSKYTVDYFIEKFSAIPAKNWCKDRFQDSRDRRCALGHCGVVDDNEVTPEARELDALIFNNLRVVTASINDSSKIIKARGPRKRILKALKLIKSRQERLG